MDLIEFNDDGLELLEEWFKDNEVLNRLGGTLPLERWHQYVQKNPNYYAWMAYEKDDPVGQIEIEIYSDNSSAMSILTNPVLRHKGYGKKMLHALLQKSEISTVQMIKVGIESDNIASLNFFKQAGFMEESIDDEGFLVYSLNLSNKG